MKQKDRHTDDKTATRPVGFASGKNSLGVLFFICIIIAHYPDLILNLAYVKTDARYQILGHYTMWSGVHGKKLNAYVERYVERWVRKQGWKCTRTWPETNVTFFFNNRIPDACWAL